MASHSSTLAWKIRWTEEPARLQSMGSQSQTRWSDFTFTFHFHALEKEMATHSSVVENPRDGGAWWAAAYGVAQSWTRLKQLSSSSSSTGLYKTGPHPPGPAFSYLRPRALHPHIHAAQASSLPALSSQSLGFAEVFWPWGRKWQPAPGFLPGTSRGLSGLWATVHGVTESQTRLSD